MSFYQTLLSVAVEHNYNLSGVFPGFSFCPTDRTRAVLANAGLLCRKSDDGIQIVYDQARIEALRMYALDQAEPLSFDFKVFSKDPDFRSYTEPFTGVEDDILYFDNLAAKGSGRQIISAAEFVSGKDFRQAESSELNTILNQKDRLLNPEFVLRIYADNHQGSLLKQWLEQPPTIYSIKFNSRQRYWKYFLLGRVVRQSETRNAFSIVDPDNRVEFETTGEEILPDSSIAYTFRSKQQIPLYDRYPFRFELRQKGNAGETTVIPSLPFASVRRSGMDAIAGKQVVVSEIYINS